MATTGGVANYSFFLCPIIVWVFLPQLVIMNSLYVDFSNSLNLIRLILPNNKAPYSFISAILSGAYIQTTLSYLPFKHRPVYSSIWFCELKEKCLYSSTMFMNSRKESFLFTTYLVFPIMISFLAVAGGFKPISASYGFVFAFPFPLLCCFLAFSFDTPVNLHGVVFYCQLFKKITIKNTIIPIGGHTPHNTAAIKNNKHILFSHSSLAAAGGQHGLTAL